MGTFKFENITIKYKKVTYEHLNDKWEEFPSVGKMRLYKAVGYFDWLKDDSDLEHLYHDIQTDNSFDIINLFEKLLNECYENKYTLWIECIHPMWIYHDLLHATEGDLFPGNHEYIKQVEPWRIKQQFEWCVENGIRVSKNHLVLMYLEDSTTQSLIAEYSNKLTASKNESY